MTTIGHVARLFTRLAALTFAVLVAAILMAAAPRDSRAATWSPCADTILNIDCATYKVPLDHSGAFPGTTTVRAVRVAAPEGPRAGTIFVIAGGPGQSALEMATLMMSLFGGANRYDIVAVDQRGSGASEPLNCPRIESGQFALIGDSTRNDWPVTQCADAVGPARAHYDTAAAVADLEVVRADIGADRISLFGVSYGTKVALAYAGKYPANTRAVLIDSVLPTNEPSAFDVDAMTAARRALNQICSAGRCRGITGRPVGDVSRLARQLERLPIPTFLVDPMSGRVLESRIDDDALYQLLLQADVNPFIYNQLPAGVSSALRGDTSMLTRLYAIAAGAYSGFNSRRAAKRVAAGIPKRRKPTKPQPGKRIAGRDAEALAIFSSTMNLTTNCNDLSAPWARGSDPATRQPAINAASANIAASAASPFPVNTLRDNSLAVLCRGWRESPNPPALSSAPAGIPVLALNGSLDLRTPTEWARRAVAGNPSAELREIAFGGHSVIGTDVTGCALSLAKRFLIFGGTDGSCNTPVQRMPIAPRGNSSVRAVAPLSGSCRGVRGSACRRARQAVTAGYLALRDTVDQMLIGGQVLGPGLYSGSWEVELDFDEEDILALDIMFVEMNDLSNVFGTSVSGNLNLMSLPTASGSLSVFAGGRSYRISVSGRFAYDRRDDRVTLSATSGRQRVTLRTSGRRSSSAQYVSASEFNQRLRYSRVAGGSSLLR